MDRLVAPWRAEVECYVLDRSIHERIRNKSKFNIIICICNKNLCIDAGLDGAFHFAVPWATECCA